MEAKLRAAFESWPKGPALPKDDIQLHARQARLLPRPQRRRKPEQHSHGRARHHARQSRLLRHQRLQRSLRRRILLAPVQRHPHQARTRLQRRRRHRHQLRPSRHSAGRDGHQEPEHDRSHSGRAAKTSTISPKNPSPKKKSSTPKTPSSTPSSSASTRPTKFSASA